MLTLAPDHGVLPSPPSRNTLSRPGSSLHSNSSRHSQLLPSCSSTRIHDEVITPDLASLVCEQVRNYIVCQGAALKSKVNEDAATTTGVQPARSPLLLFHARRRATAIQSRDLRVQNTLSLWTRKVARGVRSSSPLHYRKRTDENQEWTGIWHKILLGAFSWLRDNTRTKVNDCLRVSRIVGHPVPCSFWNVPAVAVN